MKKSNVAMLIAELEDLNKYYEIKKNLIVLEAVANKETGGKSREEYLYYSGIIKANEMVLKRIEEITNEEKETEKEQETGKDELEEMINELDKLLD